jgi:4-amino-4-deoxy-L-arabinose transferase-like glycosyltransferase
MAAWRSGKLEQDRGSVAWRGFGLLAGVLFAYPLLLAPAIPLLDPDEGLHASIAQEMVERGDWLVPRLHGQPFLDKPILYFWAQAASLRAFGMSETAVRLPGLLFGLLGVLTTALLAGRLFNRSIGVLAGLFYATMILPTALAQAAAHDVALVPWVNLALLCLWKGESSVGQALPDEQGHLGLVTCPTLHRRRFSVRHSLTYTLGAGLFLGLALLTKGLIGVAVVGLSFTSYLIITHRLRWSSCLRGAAALAVATVIASIWYLTVEQRIPGYLNYYFVNRHLLGFATETQRHGGKPWWYYLPLLLGGGLPWVAYLPAVAQDGWVRWRAGRKGRGRGAFSRDAASSTRNTQRENAPRPQPTTLVWCWLIASVLFLSASHSKLVTYLWPVFPAVAILAAVAWTRLSTGELTGAAQRTLTRTFWLSCLGGPLFLPVTVAFAQREYGFRLSAGAWLATLVIAAGTWAPIWFWTRKRYQATLTAAMAATAIQFALVVTIVLPRAAEGYSARELARHLNQRQELPPRLIVAGQRIGSLVFYLKPELRAGLRAEQFRTLKLRRMDHTLDPNPGDAFAVPESQLADAARRFNVAGTAYRRVGRYRLYDAVELLHGTQIAARDGERRR